MRAEHRSTRRHPVPPGRQAPERLPPTVVLLARCPALGRVKTRLARELGARAALSLYRAFLFDTLGWLSALRRAGWRVRVEWSESFRPGGDLARRLRGMEQSAQIGGPLGRRIEAALRRSLARGARCAVAVGADSPHLGPSPLERARRRMEAPGKRAAGVVLGPAEDGGYYLIGAQHVRRAWFTGIDWGGELVMQQTLARLRRDRTRVAVLRKSYDLDTPASLLRLRRALGRSAALRLRLPATRRILRRLRIF